MTDWTPLVLDFRRRLVDGERRVEVLFSDAPQPGQFGTLVLIADEYGYSSVQGNNDQPHVFTVKGNEHGKEAGTDSA